MPWSVRITFGIMTLESASVTLHAELLQKGSALAIMLCSLLKFKAMPSQTHSTGLTRSIPILTKGTLNN